MNPAVPWIRASSSVGLTLCKLSSLLVTVAWPPHLLTACLASPAAAPVPLCPLWGDVFAATAATVLPLWAADGV